MANGDFAGLEPWEQAFYVIAIEHCEGPDHMDRMNLMDAVIEGIIGRFSEVMIPMGDRFRAQHARVKTVIERFGRHPHRNDVLGRPSTPDEEAYVAKGDFPHVRDADPGPAVINP